MYIVGMVIKKEIDTSLLPLSVTPERRVAVQFAYPIRKYEYLFVPKDFDLYLRLNKAKTLI